MLLLERFHPNCLTAFGCKGHQWVNGEEGGGGGGKIMATTPTNENKGGTATSKTGQIEYC